jgi:phage terminase large subunit-like protein
VLRICVRWGWKQEPRNTCYEVDMGFPGADYYTIEAVGVGTATRNRISGVRCMLFEPSEISPVVLVHRIVFESFSAGHKADRGALRTVRSTRGL